MLFPTFWFVFHFISYKVFYFTQKLCLNITPWINAINVINATEAILVYLKQFDTSEQFEMRNEWLIGDMKWNQCKFLYISILSC